MSALPPHTDPAALLGIDAVDGVDAVARALLRPLGTAAVVVYDRELRLLLGEGPLLAAAGYGTQLVRGRALDDVVPAPTAEQLTPHFRATLAGERRAFELADVGADRVYGIVAGPITAAAGDVVGGVALALDLTERATAGRQNAEAVALYRLLAETGTDVVTLHDLDGRYRYVSPSVRALLGREPGEMLGAHACDFVHPDDVETVQATLGALADGHGSSLVTYRLRRADGGYVWVESSLTTIRAPHNGEARELRVSSRDITERKEHEARAAAMEAELRRRLSQASAVARLGERALEDPDLATLFDAAVRAVAETLEVPLAAALELGGPGEPLVVRAAFGFGPDALGAAVEPVRRGGPEALDLLADGPVAASGDDRFHAAVLDERGVRSTVQVLVGDREQPWGVLTAHSVEEREFDHHDRDFLSSVAHVLGDAIGRRRAEECARHDALHDRLTGLPNRTLLTDRLRQGLRRRNGGRVALLLLDLDDLKVVNESLGHAAGDAVLTDVGPRLRSALRPGDTIARFGGDTFAVVCEDITDETHAQRLAERVVGAFSRPFVIGEDQHFVTASIGVVVSSGGEDPEGLLRDADTAMYRAKEAGHGQVELFDPKLRARAVARLRIESDLRRALVRDELRLQFQPYWSLPDRELAGVEALVRWDHPQRGLIAPGDFVPVAEDSGLIVPVGTWVLREACRQWAAWRRRDPRAAALRLRVNLSARQVSQPGLVDLVARALADHEVPPEKLGLEITEGLLMQDSEAIAATLRGLKDVGVRLVLDDFGTGYSSLSYLQRFPIDQLKIDRTFVAGIEHRAESRAIVRAIVGMAHALGLGVVPEGVETEAQLAALAEMGCEFAQGFLLARPLEADEIMDLL